MKNKNQSQARSNGSKRNLPAQSKTKPATVHNPPDTVTVRIQEEDGQETPVDMSLEFFLQCKHAAKDRGISMQQLFVDALQKHCPIRAQGRAGDTPAPKPPMSAEDLARHEERRARAMQSDVRLDIVQAGGLENQELCLTEYLAETLSDFHLEIWEAVISKLDNEWHIVNFGECVKMAMAICEHGRTSGRAEAFPTRFHLLGVSSKQDFGTPREVLEWLAFGFDKHRAAIRERILEPMNICRGKIDLAEALVVAQAVVTRCAGDDDHEQCRADRESLTKLAQKIKAAHYSGLFNRSLIRRNAEIERDRIKDQADDAIEALRE